MMILSPHIIAHFQLLYFTEIYCFYVWFKNSLVKGVLLGEIWNLLINIGLFNKPLGEP